MLSLLLALAVNGAPMDVFLAKDVEAAMGKAALIHGTVRRVSMSKGPHAWEGTGVVLDDGTIVYVNYSEPPKGWGELVGKYVRVKGTLAPELPAPQQSLRAPHLIEAAKPEPTARQLQRLAGQQVRLQGRAEDAKGGAVLLLEREPLYLKDVSAWPTEVRGKALEVSGTLQHLKLIPSPTRDASGAISQGAEGSQWVLLKPQWNQLP